MPKFLKDHTIVLLEGGIEAYLLALFGMSVPSQRVQRKKDIKYAPVMGLFGTATELLAKACLVQANGISEMYKDGDVESGVYRYGSDVIESLRRHIRDEDACISYIWGDAENHSTQKEQLLHCLGKFKLLQELRANGLHAGRGSSRDITISAATDIYGFVELLSLSKRLRPYLRNVPAPEPTVRDREAIIEDLTRRYRTSKDKKDKVAYLQGMYLVLPYIPELKPDWIEAFDRIAVAPPTENDLSYLVKTLSDAHSIYLLKNRGGKNGLPVRVEPDDPEAIPIAIQNIKRTLSTTPDKFNNDILTANSRLEEGRLDLPPDEFVVDLYALGLEEAMVLTDENKKLTAQQTWPFVAAAYSTNGSPRPCWFIVRACDDIDQLIAYMKRAGKYGNGYLKRRLPDVLSSLQAVKDNTTIHFSSSKDSIFNEIEPYRDRCSSMSEIKKHPFSPEFLRKYPIDDNMKTIIHEFVSGNKNAGSALASIMERDSLTDDDRKYALALLPLCFESSSSNGLVSVLRTEHMKGYVSTARKMMFFADFLKNGPTLS